MYFYLYLKSSSFPKGPKYLKIKPQWNSSYFVLLKIVTVLILAIVVIVYLFWCSHQDWRSTAVCLLKQGGGRRVSLGREEGRKQLMSLLHYLAQSITEMQDGDSWWSPKLPIFHQGCQKPNWEVEDLFFEHPISSFISLIFSCFSF